jgi:hypothetical protein
MDSLAFFVSALVPLGDPAYRAKSPRQQDEGDLRIMMLRVLDNDSVFEQLLAELTDAAYSAALRYGLQGSFIDVELALWRELRQVLQVNLAQASPRLDREEGRLSKRPAWSEPLAELDHTGVLAETC